MSKNKLLSDFIKDLDSAATDSFLFTSSSPNSGGNFTVSPALPGGQTSWNVSNDGALEITQAGQWTFTAVDNGTMSLSMKGAGGGYGRDTNALGGTGGLTTGEVSYSSGDVFVVTVGSKGVQAGGAGTYGGGGRAGNLTFPGSGGGYSGIFTSSETQANAILMAGGGGGGHGWDAGSATGNGGDGGGSEGEAGTAASNNGAGGTQLAGGSGSGGHAGANGSALTGGVGGDRGSNQGSGGGGGGGYYGGGGGAAGTHNGNQNGTPGGGGSGYIGGATGFAVTNGVTTTGSGSTTEVDGTFSFLVPAGGGAKGTKARPLRTTDITNVDAPYDSASTLALIDSAFIAAKLGSDSAIVDSDANAIMSSLDVNIIPNNRLTVGSTSKRWKNIHTNKLSFGGISIDTNGLDGGNATLSAFATPSDYSFTQPAIENILVGGSGISFQGTRGHVGGGYAELGGSDANYFDITTPGNATNHGSLTLVRGPVAGFGDGTYAVYAGGANNINTPRNTIDYFTIATPGDATDFGDLTTARGWVGGASNGTYGLTAGGYNWATGGAGFNVIDYVTIASPSNATDFGDLTVGRTSRRGLTGHGDGTYAIFGGATDVIDYVTVDTPGNATDFGDLTVSRNDMGGSGANDATYAIYSGGGGSNVMDYITMATPGNATDFGDQSSTRNGAAGVSDGTYGVFCGGGNTNVMDYVTVTVPANAVDFGDLAQGGYFKAGCSGSPS